MLLTEMKYEVGMRVEVKGRPDLTGTIAEVNGDGGRVVEWDGGVDAPDGLMFVEGLRPCYVARELAGPEVRAMALELRGLDPCIRELAEWGYTTVACLGTLELYAEGCERHYTPRHPAYERVQANGAKARALAAAIEPLLEGCPR